MKLKDYLVATVSLNIIWKHWNILYDLESTNIPYAVIFDSFYNPLILNFTVMVGSVYNFLNVKTDIQKIAIIICIAWEKNKINNIILKCK